MSSDSNESSPKDLLNATKQARKLRKYSKVKNILQTGLEQFPSELDARGHPIFRKELIKFLLSRNLVDEAETFAPSGEGPHQEHWHCPLLARGFSKQKKLEKAKFWWDRVLEKHPYHNEAKSWLYQYATDRWIDYPIPFCDMITRCKDLDVKILFDVGANNGYVSLKYSKCFPEASVFSFEPAPETFETLAKKTGHVKNVHCNDIALGDLDAELKMQLKNTSTMNRLTSEQSGEGQTVRTMRIDTFCRQNNIAHIDFLKIDTEGFDLKVLQGCGDFIDKIDFIQCECSANDYNKFHVPYMEIFNFMTSKSFYLFNIYGITYEWANGGYPVCRRFDAVFINKTKVGEMENVVSE